jgi:predicted nuclease of predicted toxin-antitoxin system
MVHLRELGLQAAPDAVVLDAAEADSRVLVSADTDFGALLATSHAVGPSVVLVRRVVGRRVEQIAALLLANLPAVVADLQAGSAVALSDDHIRIRRLPIG